MSKNILRWAALSGMFAVILGAFGAHGLKPHLDTYQLGIFEKGVEYQFFHALALLAVGCLPDQPQAEKWIKWSSRLFLAGIVCFSGSLYLLACRDLLAFPVGWAGPITPIGGLCLIGAWGCLFAGCTKNKRGLKFYALQQFSVCTNSSG
ncbi:MAG: DUF423 domain-containing protein [Saprospirales bacterium]|nr:DUF423 domain-containing protein [Saprospirales bacterium]